MDPSQRLLGQLQEFQRHSERRFDAIEKKLDALNEFKWRMAGGGVVLGIILTGLVEFIKAVISG